MLVVDAAYFTLPYDLHFCRALAGAGAEVELIGRPLRAYEAAADEPYPIRPLFYRLSESGGGWRTTPAMKLLKGFEHMAGLVALERLARKVRPDIIHLQWLVLPILDIPMLRRLRRRSGLVLTAHNSTLAAHKTARGLSNVGVAAQQTGRGKVLELFDGFIAHTEQTRAHLEGQGVEPDRIRVIPHPPLDLRDVPAAPADGVVRVLLFGSLKPYKGLSILVRAALDLLPAREHCRIDVVGRPFMAVDDERETIAAAGLSHRFGFDLRYIPDDVLARYLAAADIVVFPYLQIDASGAFALAVAAGKPIVASRVGVFAESPAAEHVELVPPGDAKALAIALARLVDDAAARRELASRTRALNATVASWPAFAASCLDFYRQRLAAR
ncbi:MAG: glycosyltransferase family 4 protein [Geminicoccaceae bacterium]